ncbi:hypothetical protein GQ457_08G026110 [Hibiscus cannabinus]
MEVGPDGDEVGPFPDEPEPVDMPMGADDDDDDIRTEFTPYDPPSHFSTNNMAAFNDPTFSEFPQVEQYNQRIDGELKLKLVLKTKKLAEAAIKNYNIRHSVETKVHKNEADKYIAECVHKNQGCKWRIRVSCRKRLNNLCEITKLEHPYTCTVGNLSQSYRILDLRVLRDAFIPLVKANPRISILSCIASTKSLYGYDVAHMHIAANFFQKYKSENQCLMLLRMEIRVRNPEGHEYLLKIPREKWLRSFDGGHRYGHMKTNLAEAINSSLKVFQTFKYPCSHAIATATSVRIPYMQFVDQVYLLETVFKVYEHEFPPIGNEYDLDVVDDEPTIQPNPALRRDPVGRPTSSHIYFAEDMVQH